MESSNNTDGNNNNNNRSNNINKEKDSKTDFERQSILEEDLKADESLVEIVQKKLIQYCNDHKLDVDECFDVCNDINFIRRILVSSLNVETKAYKLGISCLQFRNKYKPRSLTPNKDFPIAASQNIYSIASGYSTQKGWPVLYVKAKLWNPWKYTTDEYIKMIAFTLETGEKAMDPHRPLSRMYIIQDMNQMSLLYNDLRKVHWLAKLTSEYYPERCIGVAVNADLVTKVMWNIFSPMLDSRTRDGVSIYRPGIAGQDFLKDVIGMDIVTPSLGGNLENELPPLSQHTSNQYRWSNYFSSTNNSEEESKQHETSTRSSSSKASSSITSEDSGKQDAKKEEK